MVAGIFVLAAPVAGLAATGVGIATHLKNKQLKQEKREIISRSIKKTSSNNSIFKRRNRCRSKEIRLSSKLKYCINQSNRRFKKGFEY